MNGKIVDYLKTAPKMDGKKTFENWTQLVSGLSPFKHWTSPGFEWSLSIDLPFRPPSCIDHLISSP
jgi:hypothetical protein